MVCTLICKIRKKRSCFCRLHASTIGHPSLSWPDGDKMGKVRLVYIHNSTIRRRPGHWWSVWGFAICTLTFWILFNAICSLYHSPLFDLLQILFFGLYSFGWERCSIFFSSSASRVTYVTTQKHRFAHSHRCLNDSRRFGKFLPPLSSLTVFSAVLDSKKVFSRYYATDFR